jgi:anti-anti-sigma regulatory factor
VTIIHAPEQCTIAHIKDLHRLIVEAFATGEDLVLDCGSVQQCDVTLIQLIVAGMRTSTQRKTSFQVVEAPPDLHAQIRSAGLKLGPDGHTLEAA